MSSNLNFGSLSSHTQGVRLTGTLLASLVAVAVTGLIALWGVSVVFGSVFSGIGGEGEPSAELAKLVAAHEAEVKTAQDRFNGRSIFFKPPPSYVAPKPEPKLEPKREEPKPAPDPVVTYAGPTPIYAIGDTVWFKPPRQDDPQLVLSVGDEEKHGVTVISTNLPWSVKLGWRGKEFDLDIFKRKAESFLVTKAPAMTLIPGLVAVPAPTVDLAVPKASGEIDDKQGEDPNMVDPEDKPGAPSPEAGNNEPGESPDDPEDAEAKKAGEETNDGQGKPTVEAPPVEDPKSVPVEPPAPKT